MEFDKVFSSYNKVTYLGDYNIVDRPMDVFLHNESEIHNDLQFLQTDELKIFLWSQQFIHWRTNLY